MNCASQSFSVELAKTLGGVEQAVILGELNTWSINNSQHKEMCVDGNVWVRCSRAAMKSVFPYISEWRIRTILCKLVDSGYLVRGDYSEHLTDKSSWFCLTEKAKSLFGRGTRPLEESTNPLDEISNALDEFTHKTDDLREREKESNIKKESKENKKEVNKKETTISYDMDIKKEEKKEEVSLFGGYDAADCHEETIATCHKHPKEETSKSCAASNEEKLKARGEKFRVECMRFAGEFGTEMIDHFVEYWTEPNKSKTSMRFELERTWDTHRRLLTWSRNNFHRYNRQEQPERQSISANEALKRAGWI